jgi:predicted Rossmann fold nucleotide-binding protein DprA/Smf involved in DNA uptake
MKEIKNLLGAHLPPMKFEFEQEEYILTEGEETAAIEHEINRQKQHLVYKRTQGNMMKKEIAEAEVNLIDWKQRLNIEHILFLANSNKHHEIWQKQQNEKRKAAETEAINNLRKTWTAKMMLRFMRWTCHEYYGKSLIENEYTLPLIKAVCFFLSEDERFETELGYSFGKGLLIRGKCGLGKTFAVKCVAQNELNPVSIHSMLEISEAVKEDGVYELSGKKIYIDDVGSEQAVVNHYGTKINWLKEFLETFYLRSNHYNKLILSTNLNFSQIEDVYGFRVRSRLKDMFNVIDVEGKDLRG